jgi:hypothetical protein
MDEDISKVIILNVALEDIEIIISIRTIVIKYFFEYILFNFLSYFFYY